MQQQISIYREFTFDSAHFLSKVPEGHKCHHVHGHTYRLKIYLKGYIDHEKGWLMDFAELKEVCNSVIERVDHQLLNDIDGLENPSCEILAAWLWKRLKFKLPLLSRLELNETSSCGVLIDSDTSQQS